MGRGLCEIAVPQDMEGSPGSPPLPLGQAAQTAHPGHLPRFEDDSLSPVSRWMNYLLPTAPPYLTEPAALLPRVHLDIQVGEHANNYPEIAAKDKLTELQLRARQLLDQVEQIQKEQNYQRFREERFRMTSESTNQRVLWWSIAQTVILLLTGIWQMRHLKSFFEAKKLV
ncbi:hypothetical protein L345_09691, partial [Ophiophagus hannah]